VLSAIVNKQRATPGIGLKWLISNDLVGLNWLQLAPNWLQLARIGSELAATGPDWRPIGAALAG